MAGTTKATYHLHERETIGQALADARGREPVLGSASGVIGILPEGGGTQYVPMFKDTLPTDGNVPCFSSTGNLLDIGDGEMKIYPGNPDGVVVGASKLGTAMLEICGWFDTDYLLQSWYDQTGDVRAELGLDSVGSAYFTLYDADDVPHTIDADVIGTLVGSSVKWDAAYAHISESGESHTYIDQDLRTSADVIHKNLELYSSTNGDTVLKFGNQLGEPATITFNRTNTLMKIACDTTFDFEIDCAKYGALGAAAAAQRAHVADPTGGATVDAEARTAINAILVSLETFGFHAAV